MGSATAKEKGSRFSAPSYQDLKLPNDELVTGREALAELNRPAGWGHFQRKRDGLTGTLPNSLPLASARWALGSVQKTQAIAAKEQAQAAAKPAASSSTAPPQVTYKPNKPNIPAMRPETQAIVEKAARQAGISSIKVSSTQEARSGHAATSNHYNRPGKIGTSADISEIDGRPVVNYSRDPYLKQKVDAFQNALDQYGAHENYGPSRLSRDHIPVPQITPQQKRLRRDHQNHIHVDPPRRTKRSRP